MTSGRCVLSLLSALLAASVPLASRQADSDLKAVPRPAIRAILDAFRSHAIVALADIHGSEQVHAFRLSLVRDPAFPALVNDIVVEFGSARYQSLMDGFVRGEKVPDKVLRQVWQNTTQVTGVWDRPIYEEFFRAVRAVNAGLPPERQLRVVLGDPPVDRSEAGTAGRWTPQRDRFAADVIAREVLAKRHRALVLYGGGHLFRAGQSLTSLVERNTGTTVFTISVPGATTFSLVESLQPDVISWPVPSLAVLQDTVLHQRELVYYDALLYLGHPSAMTFSKLSPELCADEEYVRMRLKRLAPLGQRRIDEFRAECALRRR